MISISFLKYLHIFSVVLKFLLLGKMSQHFFVQRQGSEEVEEMVWSQEQRVSPGGAHAHLEGALLLLLDE